MKKHSNINDKLNEIVFEKLKKKYKLNLYSKSRFELKFGENIYRFVSNLESTKEGSNRYKETLDKIRSAETLGRRIIKINKKLNF